VTNFLCGVCCKKHARNLSNGVLYFVSFSLVQTPVCPLGHTYHPNSALASNCIFQWTIYLWLYSPCGPWPLFQFLNLYTVGLLGWGISPSQGHYYLHTKQHKQNKRTQTSMPRVGFEPMIPAFEWAKTVHGLDCAAIVIGILVDICIILAIQCASNMNDDKWPIRKPYVEQYHIEHVQKLEQNTVIHNHSTCQKLNLHVQFCRMNYFNKCIMNMVIDYTILYQIKLGKEKEIGKFKRELRSYLLQHTFYSVDEFMSC
jgi:hypothetical protein